MVASMPIWKSAAGQPVHYRRQGRRTKKAPLLLVHGAGGDGSHWAEAMRLLARERLVVAVDLPGHGSSPWATPVPAPEALLAHYAEILAALAEDLGLGRFVIAGHSMGGAVAQRFAWRYADRLSALLLVASGARFPVSRALIQQLDRDFERLPETFVETCYSPESDRGQVARWAAAQLRCDKAQLLADFEACRLFDGRAELPQIELLTAVIAARDDVLVPPRFQEQLAAGVARGRLITTPRAGHFVLIEKPQTIVEACAMLDGALARGTFFEAS